MSALADGPNRLKPLNPSKHPRRRTLMNRTLISACSFALLCALSSTASAVTFNIFPDPPPPMTQGTVGFTYAGNKFVGSVLQNGTGSLYSTDLNGANVQPFAPAVS